MTNHDRETRIRTLYIYKLLYTGCSTKKSNNTGSFTEHLKFFKKVTLTHAPWVNSGKWKPTKLKSEHYTIWKCYIQGASQKK